MKIYLFVLLVCGCFESTGQNVISKLTKKHASVRRDYREYLKTSANQLQGVSPTAKWGYNDHYADLEFAQVLQNGNVLLGVNYLVPKDLIQIRGNVPGPYVCIDPATGEEKWRFETRPEKWIDEEDQFTRYLPMLTKEMVLIKRTVKDQDTYIALNADTGSTEWSATLSSNHSVALDYDQNILYIARVGFDLIGIHTISGDTIWSESYDDHILPYMLTEERGLWVVSNKSCYFYPLKVGSSSRFNLESQPNINHILPTYTGIILPVASNKISFLSSDGIQLWEYAIEQEADQLSITGGYLLIKTKTSETTSGMLILLDIQTGSEVWKRPLPDAGVHSDFKVYNETLYFCTQEQLYLYNISQGEVIKGLPLGFQNAELLLPFRIRFTEEGIVVASEAGVRGFNLEGVPLYEVDASGYFRYTYYGCWYTAYDKPPEKSDINSTSKSDRNKALQFHNAYLPSNRSRQTAAIETRLARTITASNRVLSSSSSTPSQRASAIRDKQAAIQRAMTETRMQQDMAKMEARNNMLGASASFLISSGESVRAINDAAYQASVVAHTRTVQARVGVSLMLDAYSLQGEWYVRPFTWEEGMGVLLVNLKTGQWREIVTSPVQIGLDEFYVNLPVALIADDGKTLISHGIGLETEKWQDDSDWVRDVTFKRSSLGFDLSTMDLHNPEDFPARNFKTLYDQARK